MVEISKFLQGFTGSGGFLDGIGDGIGSGPIPGLTGTRTVTGTPTRIIPSGVESGLSTRRIINQIEDLVDRNLVQSTQFQFEAVQVPLFNLQQNQSTFSSALNEQITIRENQRATDQESVNNLKIFTESVNERLSQQVTQLGKSLGDLSVASFDPIKFFTDNPLIGGIGIGGLLIGGVVLLVLLK